MAVHINEALKMPTVEAPGRNTLAKSKQNYIHSLTRQDARDMIEMR